MTYLINVFSLSFTIIVVITAIEYRVIPTAIGFILMNVLFNAILDNYKML